MKQLIIILMIIICTLSCKTDNVKGIKISNHLLIFQTVEENRVFVNLIENTLDGGSNSFKKLLGFSCGGGVGCYDLGVIFSQLAFQIGEEKFMKLCFGLDLNEKQRLKGLLQSGLEYGDNNNDGVADNLTLAIEFPALFKMIKSN